MATSPDELPFKLQPIRPKQGPAHDVEVIRRAFSKSNGLAACRADPREPPLKSSKNEC